MHDTSKVSHFRQTPHRRLLEIYSVDATFKKVYESYSLKEKIIRFLIHVLNQKKCTLFCGRSSNRTSVKFTVKKSQHIDANIWHVEGVLGKKRKVIMLVDKEKDLCDIIQNL